MPLRLDRNFENVANYLIARESEAADAVSKQGAGRPWFNFSEAPLSEDQRTSTRDEKELHAVCDRELANQDYLEARADSASSSNQVAVAKIAGDYLAAIERDGRMRRRSRVRMIAHAAARSWGNGQDAGPLRRNTIDYLQRVFLKAREQ